MSKSRCILISLGLVVALLATNVWADDGAEAQTPDDVKVASLVDQFENMSPSLLKLLPPLPIQRYELPNSSVHVMRAVVDETYAVDGIGEDTVELRGWIAVKHNNPRPKEGATELSWESAIFDTEFVGMHLRGESELFGSVEVILDEAQENVGQVGNIELPDAIRAAIPKLANLGGLPEGVMIADLGLEEEADESDDESASDEGEDGEDMRQPSAPKFKPLQGTRTLRGMPEGARPPKTLGPKERKRLERDLLKTRREGPDPFFCAAGIGGKIIMKDLGLEMVTDGVTTWYSVVDTVPPVGQTASVTVDPIRLLANGRAVATLKSGIVKFREVVGQVHLLEEDPIHVPSTRVAETPSSPASSEAAGFRD